jgi:cytoskeletal protein CcmA (bactofilin family)
MIYNPSSSSIPRFEGGEFMDLAAPGEFASIGKSVSIKGELSGSEDVYVDGQLNGRIDLVGNSLTVGPNGRVHANVVAKTVTIGGTLDGNIQASERTELRKTAVVNGDVQTRRIAIEEGAYFKGRLEILAESKVQGNSGVAAVAASSASSTAHSTVEPKK